MFCFCFVFEPFRKPEWSVSQSIIIIYKNKNAYYTKEVEVEVKCWVDGITLLFRAL